MDKYAEIRFTLEYKTENIPVVKKKLQSKFRMIDLECFSKGQFCQIYFAGDQGTFNGTLCERDYFKTISIVRGSKKETGCGYPRFPVC